MIDTHCHIDLYKNPKQILEECEKAGIVTIGMTNLPSHFEMGYNHILQFKKARLSLGMHPLYANQHAKEFKSFSDNLSKTSYIGEVGLDFSQEGVATKKIQIESFDKILNELKSDRKLLSLHSRRAEKEVLERLINYNIKTAIFHWYTGPIGLIQKIIDAGYYFSINPAMIRSTNGQNIIKKIPFSNILTESDGPFIEIQNRPCEPADIRLVEIYLANLWGKSSLETSEILNKNFRRIISKIK